MWCRLTQIGKWRDDHIGPEEARCLSTSSITIYSSPPLDSSLLLINHNPSAPLSLVKGRCHHSSQGGPHHREACHPMVPSGPHHNLGLPVVSPTTPVVSPTARASCHPPHRAEIRTGPEARGSCGSPSCHKIWLQSEDPASRGIRV